MEYENRKMKEETERLGKELCRESRRTEEILEELQKVRAQQEERHEQRNPWEEKRAKEEIGKLIGKMESKDREIIEITRKWAEAQRKYEAVQKQLEGNETRRSLVISEETRSSENSQEEQIKKLWEAVRKLEGDISSNRSDGLSDKGDLEEKTLGDQPPRKERGKGREERMGGPRIIILELDQALPKLRGEGIWGTYDCVLAISPEECAQLVRKTGERLVRLATVRVLTSCGVTLVTQELDLKKGGGATLVLQWTPDIRGGEPRVWSGDLRKIGSGRTNGNGRTEIEIVKGTLRRGWRYVEDGNVRE